MSAETTDQASAPTSPRHETFRLLGLHWDVDALNARLDRATAQGERLITTDPKNLTGGLYGEVGVDETRLDTLEHPQRPLIVLNHRFESGREIRFVADGNHRLERALRRGQTQVTLINIPAEEEPAYRL